MTCLALAGSVTVTGQVAVAKSKRSTPEERARVVTDTRQVEANILGEREGAIRQRLLKWWVEVPDVSLKWCAPLLLEFEPADKAFGSALVVQGTLSGGAYVLEHPEASLKERDVWIAGVQGALRAYQSVLSRDPSRTDPFLEKLVALDKAGRIGEYVDSHAADCK